ncbi:type I pantothenate kinase [Dactylosporangium sp. NPDC051484]|uniref:type I pantothenate kinase n=1 Tax=Dactylosporangium sp. NPDC051484 TaxID=3154942 RepID=UPI00344FDC29
MTQTRKAPVSLYHHFDRSEWAALRGESPMALGAQDLPRLRGLGDALSLDEIEQIYLPLCRLVSLHIEQVRNTRRVAAEFLDRPFTDVPYIIGIVGSVAVGKSTLARVLQALLAELPGRPGVDLVTTDGFLLPNAELERRRLINRKGFPASYDRRRLVRFLSDVRARRPELSVPVYSHLVYDIVPGRSQLVDRPDILIVEGLNLLQNTARAGSDVLASDFLDFSIYLDANEPHIRQWYTERFLTLRRTAFQDPVSYFHRYSALTDAEAVATAGRIWDEINQPNLVQNIRPTRERARLVLHKGPDHLVDSVRLRRI